MSYVNMKQAFFNSCQRIPLLYRYSITILMLILFIFIWYFFVQPYMQDMLFNKEFEYQQLQEKYLLAQKAVSNYNLLLSQTNNLLYQTEHIKQMSYDDVIFSIMHTAQKYSLVCTQYTYDKNIDRPWYSKKQVSFCMRGTLQNNNEFLQYIHTVPELISCNALAISKHDSLYELVCTMRYAQIKPLQLSLQAEGLGG